MDPIGIGVVVGITAVAGFLVWASIWAKRIGRRVLKRINSTADLTDMLENAIPGGHGSSPVSDPGPVSPRVE